MKRITWRRKLLFSFVAITALLACLEIALRLIHPPWINLVRSHFAIYDEGPHGELSLAPGSSGHFLLTWENDPRRYEYSVYIDERGLRTPIADGSPPAPSLERKYTVYCLGDSMTFGAGVDAEKSYPAVLQSLLGSQWRVENFGVPGNGLLAAKENLERVDAELSANIVVYCFCLNDLSDDQRLAHARAMPPSSLSAFKFFKPIVMYSTVGATLPSFLLRGRYLEIPFEFAARADQHSNKASLDLMKSISASAQFPLDDSHPTFQALLRLREECDEKGVRLITMLPLSMSWQTAAFIAFCASHGFEIVYVVDDGVDIVPDGHPGADTYRFWAEQLLPVIERPTLDQSQWKKSQGASLVDATQKSNTAIALQLSDDNDKAQVLVRDGFRIEAGKEYSVQFRASTGAETEIECRVVDSEDADVAAPMQWRVKSGAKYYRTTFVAEVTTPNAAVVFRTHGDGVDLSDIGLIGDAAWINPGEERDSHRRSEKALFTSSDSWARLTWNLGGKEPDLARLSFNPRNMSQVRVEPTHRTETAPWDVTLWGHRFGVSKRCRYRVTFRARADAPRSMVATVSESRAPFGNLGFYREVALSTQWQDYAFEFQPARSEARARFVWLLGGSTIPIEFSHVVVERMDN